MQTEIIRRYKDMAQLSVKGFADACNSVLPSGLGYSAAAYQSWTYGRNPFPFTLAAYLAANGEGWVREFGEDMVVSLQDGAE